MAALNLKTSSDTARRRRVVRTVWICAATATLVYASFVLGAVMQAV